MVAGWYFYQMPVKEHAWCWYCIMGAICNFGIAALAIPEAIEASKSLNANNRQQTKEVNMTATITRDELKEKIERGDKFQLVETLAPENYRHTHLPNAINMPPDRVAELAPQLLPDKSAQIVVYCASPT